ncbi:MAG: hypothetical protein A2V70_02105 [Planctomycetes bacterium RBG_13_63_9]|nr:MAG: hypothetical protein A2V70_02105 [Planctomycetes bacterium RBG_13_63_9]
MKAAVIGAGGFLGGVLCEQLCRSGWEVSGYDVAEPARMIQETRFEHLDILGDELSLPEGTDAVFYLAQSLQYREFPQCADQLFGVNVYGAVKAARAACACGAGFFCYTSTGNVYRPSLESLAEDCPVRRDEPYALSKLAAEEALSLFSGRMSVVSVRPFGLFGPGQQKMLPVALLRKIQAGEPIVLEPAAGETQRTDGLEISFCYVDDAARCLQQLARRALASAELPAVLNLAGPEPISIRRFAVTLGGILGIEPKFQRADSTRTLNLIGDVSRLRALLDPAFVPFSEAMQRTYQEVLNHGCATRCERSERSQRQPGSV